jgi:hypothetical protein
MERETAWGSSPQPSAKSYDNSFLPNHMTISEHIKHESWFFLYFLCWSNLITGSIFHAFRLAWWIYQGMDPSQQPKTPSSAFLDLIIKPFLNRLNEDLYPRLVIESMKVCDPSRLHDKGYMDIVMAVDTDKAREYVNRDFAIFVSISYIIAMLIWGWLTYLFYQNIITLFGFI